MSFHYSVRITLTIQSRKKDTWKQFTMNIGWIFCAVLLQNCIKDVLPRETLEEFDESSNWVDNLIKYINQTTNGQQITLLTNLKKNETLGTGPSIEELFTKIVERYRTLRINVGSFNETQEWVLNHGIKDAKFFDSSNAFFIFIHHSIKPFDTPSSRKTIDAMAEISASKLSSQFLLILVSQNLTNSLEEFFKHAWTHQLLDFTIFEFVETKTSDATIRVDYEIGTPIIHQFNPFKMLYTRTNWTSDTEWFPDKLINMWGYPIKTGVSDRPPYSLTTFDEFTDPSYVGGANIDFLKIIARTANFTLKYLRDLRKTSELNRRKTPEGIFDLMQSGKVDVIAYLSPHYTENMKELSLRTTTILLNKLCTVIPILPRAAVPFSSGFLEVYLVYFGIVTAFWVSSHVLRFKSHSWYPFNIARTMLGVSPAKDLKGISERVLYACLLLVAAIFSSSIHTAMTGLSLQTNYEMDLRSFEDLDKTNFGLQINPYLFNKTFAYSDADLSNLKAKTKTMYGNMLSKCPVAAVKYKNTSCLLLNDEAKLVVQTMKHHGRPVLKLTELCFWSDSTAFLVGKRSPYRSRMDDIITLMKDTGLVDKCYKDVIATSRNEPADDDHEENDNDDAGLDQKQNMRSLRRQLYAIITIGYTVSIVTFVGEVAFGRIIKYKSKTAQKAYKTKEALQIWKNYAKNY